MRYVLVQEVGLGTDTTHDLWINQDLVVSVQPLSNGIVTIQMMNGNSYKVKGSSDKPKTVASLADIVSWAKQ